MPQGRVVGGFQARLFTGPETAHNPACVHRGKRMASALIQSLGDTSVFTSAFASAVLGVDYSYT